MMLSDDVWSDDVWKLVIIFTVFGLVVGCVLGYQSCKHQWFTDLDRVRKIAASFAIVASITVLVKVLWEGSNKTNPNHAEGPPPAQEDAQQAPLPRR